MLGAADFFDLTDFEHRAVFDGTEFVWEALERLESYLETQVRPARLGTVEPGAVIQGAVYLGPGSRVEAGATVIGPALIDKDALVRQGAYIRGRVLVGAGALVGHATEVKNSILLPEAKAPHFNYVGDSILGRRVNLGAGSILSNLKVTPDTISVQVGDHTYSTGLRKLGGILGDECETGCNCVLNPGTLIGPRTLAYPLTSLRGYYPPDSIIKLRQQHQVVERRAPVSP